MTQLKTVKDSCFFDHITTHAGYVYAFIASLDTTEPEPKMVYNITCDGEALQALAEIPAPVLAEYGVFVSYVEAWANGGELHESLKHDD